MKPTALTLKLLAALFAGGALLTALPAHAGRDDDRRHYYDDDDRGWRGEHRGRGYYKERHKHRERVVIKEKVIIKERPVVREYHYHERPSYSYSRDPAIVIGVNVPPIVIPLP